MDNPRPIKATKPAGSYLKVVPKLKQYGFVVTPLIEKRPILKGWNKLDHTPEKLYVFENRNFGILTGSVSGVTVLDIDTKEDGLKLWKALSSCYPEIITPMVKTGNGGLHIYFRYNPNLPSFSRFNLRGKRIGWDLLNNDRQVVAPPSVIDGSKKYKWIRSPDDSAFAQMPLWLERYLLCMKSLK